MPWQMNRILCIVLYLPISRVFLLKIEILVHYIAFEALWLVVAVVSIPYGMAEMRRCSNAIWTEYILIAIVYAMD